MTHEPDLDRPDGEALAFLRALYGPEPAGRLTLWTARDRATRWPPDLLAMARLGPRLAGRDDVYFGVGLRRARLRRGRGGAGDVLALPALWADIDILGPNHSAGGLPPDAAAGRAILDGLGLPPTAVVDSGYGLHAYWCLDTPFLNGSPAATLALLRSFGDGLAAVAARDGWAIDRSVFEPARVLRLPGTINHKGGERRPVRLVELEPERRYPAAELLAAAAWALGRPGAVEAPDAGLDAADALVARAKAYARAAIAQAERDLGSAPDGQRNRMLNRVAFGLGGLAAALEPRGWPVLTEANAWSALWLACQQNGLATDPRNGGERACRRTFGSGWRAGQRAPRELPAELAGSHRPSSARNVAGLLGGVVVERSEAGGGDPARPGGGVLSARSEAGGGDPRPHCVPGAFRLSDTGNAARLATLYGDRLRHCDALRRWFVWDGRRWRADDTRESLRYAIDTAHSITDEARAAEGLLVPKRVEALARWALASCQRSRVAALLELAQNRLAMRVDGLDAQPWLLTCLDGTIDLRTGALLAHDPAHHITCLAPARYVPDAHEGADPDLAPAADLWRGFLETLTGGDAELATFLQRAVGLTLIGEPLENVMFLPHGPGGTAKTTFFDVLLGLLGDYAAKVTASAFMWREGATSLRPDIAKLRGARLVVCDETNRGRRLDVGLVNDLTGSTHITARSLYQEEITFRRTFTPWIASNYRPEIREDESSGIWRRLREIPFDHVVAPEARRPNMAAHLLEHAGPAVLAWAVRGALDYQRDGLPASARVEAATAGYRTEMDPLYGWLEERCLLTPEAWTSSDDVWASYKGFCEAGAERPLSRRDLAGALARHAVEISRRYQRRGYAGIALIADPE